MTHTLNRNAFAIIAASLLLFLGSFAAANAAARETTGCAGTCPTPQRCYEVTGGGAPQKMCLTPEAARGYNQGTPPQTSPTPGSQPRASESGGTGVTLSNPLKVDNVEGLLALVLSVAVRIGTIILVLALVWTGFLFVAARGNPEKISSARQAFMWTIIGGLVLLGAEALAQVIKDTATSLGS